MGYLGDMFNNMTFQNGVRGVLDPFMLTSGLGVPGGDNGAGGQGFNWPAIIAKYSYMPKYTAETEKGLYDLFQSLTGLGGGGVNAIPFDIGLPTTGLYDALTRSIKEDYLGTPGGPEGGRIADLRAYYNNLGIPEQAINQERLANRDMNNSLTDVAAKINETQKDRLLNVLNMGSGIGNNLYAQNLAQHRSNAGLGMQGAGMEINMLDAIRQANQANQDALYGGIGSLLGTAAGAYFGGPVGASIGGSIGGNLGDLFTANRGSVSRGGGALYNPYFSDVTSDFRVRPLFGSGSEAAKLI